MKREEIEALLPTIPTTIKSTFFIPVNSTVFEPAEAGRLRVVCPWILRSCVMPGYIGFEPVLPDGGYSERAGFLAFAPSTDEGTLLLGKWKFAGVFADGPSVDDYLSQFEITGSEYDEVETQQETGSDINQPPPETPIKIAARFLRAVQAGSTTVEEAAPELLNQLERNRILRWGWGAI